MNKVLTSLVVLGAVAFTSPAFAKTSTVPAPVKGAKIVANKTASKVSAPLKHKHSKCSIKKTK